MNKESSTQTTVVWHIIELEFESLYSYDNQYTDVDLFIKVTTPNNEEKMIQGFWDGNHTWKIRFAPWLEGEWQWKSVSSVKEDRGLHGKCGTINVVSYEGNHLIYNNGFLKVGPHGRGFVHYNEKPFFWLGDTAWAISAKVTLEEWKEYISYRCQQGYNLVQINSLPQFDASISCHREPFIRINDKWDYAKPSIDYFRYLDRIMEITHKAGIFTAMVVLWFDYVLGTNPEWSWISRNKGVFTPKLAKKFGRYLSARYAAYGTIWIISGDSDYKNPYAIETYDAAAEGIREASPYKCLMTAHLNGSIYTPEELNQKKWLDFHMYQSSHSKDSCEKAIYYAEKDREYRPLRPVINGEPAYELIGYYKQKEKVSREDVRKVAWTSILAGGNAGITYGAHGIWSWHGENEEFMYSDSWGAPNNWREALRFKGARDFVRMKNFLIKIPWWELEFERNNLCEEKDVIVAATTDQKMIIIYMTEIKSIHIMLDKQKKYEITWINPGDGKEHAADFSWNRNKIYVKHPSWNQDAILFLVKK